MGTFPHYWSFVRGIYSISQEICTRFLLCCALFWLCIDWFSHIYQAYFTGTVAPVPAKQPWWIWINTLCEFIMNDCITTTKQSTTKPCAYFLGYTVLATDGCTHKGSIKRSLVLVWKKVSNKQSIDRWFKTQWFVWRHYHAINTFRHWQNGRTFDIFTCNLLNENE